MTLSVGLIDSGLGSLVFSSFFYASLDNKIAVNFKHFSNVSGGPVGSQSDAFLHAESEMLLQKMQEEKCDVNVIACNTLSCFIKRENIVVPGCINLFDLTQKMATSIASSNQSGPCMLLSTCNTRNFGMYTNIFQAAMPATKIINSTLTNKCIAYLEGADEYAKAAEDEVIKIAQYAQQQNCQAIVLLCTHYPMFANTIKQHFSGQIVMQHLYFKYFINTKGLPLGNANFFIKDRSINREAASHVIKSAGLTSDILHFG